MESLDLAQAAETVSYSEVLAIYVGLEVLSKEPKEGYAGAAAFLKVSHDKDSRKGGPRPEFLQQAENQHTVMHAHKCSHI